MRLSKNMNFIELGRWIILQMKGGKERDQIENEMIKAFGWSKNQAAAATNPYYVEKRRDTDNENYVRRK